MNNIKILNAKPIQENFYGFNAVYHGFAGLSDDAGRVLGDELCDLEADRAKDLNLKIARTFYKWWSYDFQKNSWDWENAPDYVAFCKWVERLKVRGINVALNTGWCMPGDVLSNSWNGKSPFTVEGDWQASVENYAKWVSDTVYDLIKIRGLDNVKYLFLFTEPQRLSGTLPNEVKNAYECWYQCATAVVERLRKNGLYDLVKIIGPNEGSTVNAPMMQWLYKKDKNLVDFYSSHNYMVRILPKCIWNSADEVKWIEVRGGRWFCPTKLKPNTEYTLDFEMMLNTEDYTTVSGYVLAGAFKGVEDARQGFSSGGSATTRLNRFSTFMIEAAHLDKEFAKFTFTFKTTDDVDNALVGFFSDVVGTTKNVFIKSITLKETGTDIDIINHSEWNCLPRDVFNCKDNHYDFWYEDVKIKIDRIGKNVPFWYDEYNCIVSRNNDFSDTPEQPLHGTYLAAARVAFLNCGIQNSFMWTLFDQQWPSNHNCNNVSFFDGDHRCGVMPALLRSKVPYPAYFAMRITGLVNGDYNSKIYKGVDEGKIKGAMVKNPDGNLTVLLVNETECAEEFNITFEEDINVKFNCYMYDPAKVICDEKIPELKAEFTTENIIDSLKGIIPAGGVIAYSTK